MPHNTKYSKAFTLAEVLITLSIIGILAALTIPSLINNSNDKALKEQWRKAYSTLANATNLLIQENGGTMKGSYSSNDAAGWQEIIDMYSTKMNAVKTCNNTNIDDCWYKYNDNRKYYNGDFGSNWNTSFSHGFALADGSFWTIYNGSAMNNFNCTGLSAGTLDDTICIYFNVDVNGAKPPNQIGKDIFVVYVHENRIEPFTTNPEAPTQRCNHNSGLGGGCAARWLISDEEEASNYTGAS